MSPSAHRPLAGVRVVDVSALGPGPFCSMLLADHGAEVVSVQPPHDEIADGRELFGRGKRAVVVDLRSDRGRALVQRMADGADVFLEGYRPGVMERLGLGPEQLRATNPRLVYTRLTGWGQDGPYAARAGHDINYIAIAGALAAVGTDAPVPPVNLVGDFAGGSLMAVIGTLLALHERDRTGDGRVVDAAMVDGAALLTSGQLRLAATGQWGARGTNFLDGSAPFYTTYRTACGRYVAVGAIEPAFYRELVAVLALDPELAARQWDQERWADDRATIAAALLERPRDGWVDRFAGHDACLDPVWELDELDVDPHLAARGTISRDQRGLHAAAAPRFDGASPPAPGAVPDRGQHTDVVLAELGCSPSEITELRAEGVVA